MSAEADATFKSKGILKLWSKKRASITNIIFSLAAIVCHVQRVNWTKKRRSQLCPLLYARNKSKYSLKILIR